MSRDFLENKLQQTFGFEKSKLRAAQAYREIYKDQFYSQNFQFPTLSKEVRQWFLDEFCFEPSGEIQDTFVSQQDSSVKFILKLKKDNLMVEAVLIPEPKRLTLCVSTQVGCAQACRFCQTGRMGLMRSLTTDEIVSQLVVVEQWKQAHQIFPKQKVTNIVYMGMGEPLDNVTCVIDSAKVFCDAQAFFLSHNKVTVSTVGLMPQLDKILSESPVSLALSLHSPFEEERSKVMPVNQNHPLTKVIACLKSHLDHGTRKSFLVQYTLIRGVNDTPVHAQALIDLLGHYSFKINLIPLNEHEGTAYRRPDLGRVYEFQQMLKRGGLVATIRLSKGRDIEAACGQLIKNYKNKIVEKGI